MDREPDWLMALSRAQSWEFDYDRLDSTAIYYNTLNRNKTVLGEIYWHIMRPMNLRCCQDLDASRVVPWLASLTVEDLTVGP